MATPPRTCRRRRARRHTAAAAEDNPELVEAARRGIPILLRAEMVARLMEGKRVVAVAGAHGKTTTSSLIAFILVEAGREPMYLLGGESIDLGGHASWGDGDLCVVEADEYKRAFLEYTPDVAVITNVEPDHLDYYGTRGGLPRGLRRVRRRRCGKAASSSPARTTPARGWVSEVLGDDPLQHETYGIEGVRFWMAADIELSGERRHLRRNARRRARRHAPSTDIPASTSSATRSPRPPSAWTWTSRSKRSRDAVSRSRARGGASRRSARPAACS